MTSYQFFKMPSSRRKSTSVFKFGDATHLRRSKYVCGPNFDATSQFTAELLLLPFLKTVAIMVILVPIFMLALLLLCVYAILSFRDE